jgi:hypothetical protein
VKTVSSIHSLLSALDEREMARRVGIPHDEVRMRYALRSNTVSSFEEFSRVLGDYYNYHFTSCVARGGSLSWDEAVGRAKELLEREYRRQNGDIATAYHDAHDGTNGGLRSVLDKIAEALKAESVERYVREAFDRHVAPTDWPQKVSLIRQFIAHCGVYLASSISTQEPERYAHDYRELIRSYVTALQRTSAIFRRL